MLLQNIFDLRVGFKHHAIQTNGSKITRNSDIVEQAQQTRGLSRLPASVHWWCGEQMAFWLLRSSSRLHSHRPSRCPHCRCCSRHFHGHLLRHHLCWMLAEVLDSEPGGDNSNSKTKGKEQEYDKRHQSRNTRSVSAVVVELLVRSTPICYFCIAEMLLLH